MNNSPESKIPIEAIADAIGRSIPDKNPSVFNSANAAEDMHPIMKEINICLYPEEIEKRFHKVVKECFPEAEDQKNIYEALNFIREKHAGQYRDEHTQYHYHPMMAAIYCTEHGGWITEFLACLLHDVFEDTDTKFNELKDLFGWNVADLVRIVSFSVDGEIIPEEEYYENLKGSKSWLLVKWCDRLSNIYSCLFTTNTEWKEEYYKRTMTQVIPLLKSYHPDLSEKIEEAIVYLETAQITERQKNQLADLKKIREITEKLGK